MNSIFQKSLVIMSFLITFGFMMSINNCEAKADMGTHISKSINVHSTKVKINRVIKIAPRKSKREVISRGGSSKVGRVVDYSYNFLGKPYVWGASGPSSFDCSGFTSYVFRRFGYSLPHYTRAQSEMGQGVSRGNLRSGDLVFFNTIGTNRHVGIYIGNGRFIHASSGRGKVTVSDLGESYYRSRYSKARRILE